MSYIMLFVDVDGLFTNTIRTPNSLIYSGKFSMEIVLITVIICIISVSLLFFLMTLYKKIQRIKEIKEKQKFQEIIDELLFNFLFNDKSVREIIEFSKFEEFKNDKLFQQLSIKSLINLHASYSGTYSKKLEQFFAESGLAAYALNKLNSNNWAHIVEGIKDLSSLNYLAAYPRIVSYKNHKNKFVQTEVLLGMIKLKGISELLKFKNSEVYFNEWVQSNILFVVMNYKIPAPENLLDLLGSKNNSILLLAVRLINYFGLQEHYNTLYQVYEKIEDPSLKNEIMQMLDKTEQL